MKAWERSPSEDGRRRAAMDDVSARLRDYYFSSRELKKKEKKETYKIPTSRREGAPEKKEQKKLCRSVVVAQSPRLCAAVKFPDSKEKLRRLRGRHRKSPCQT